MPTCKNCSAVLLDNYCQKCGQKATVSRIEFKWFLHELPHALWHIEKGFLFNVKELYRRPGYAIADYIHGKRKAFFNPLTYLLILFGIQYFIVNNFHISYFDPVQDKQLSAFWLEYWKVYDQTQQRLFHYYYVYLVVFIPVSALIFFVILQWLKQGYNYAECVVIAVLSTAQVVVLQSIGLIIASLVDRTIFTRIQDVVVALSFLPMFYFQCYQLGSTGSKNPGRRWKSFLGMILLFSWALGLLMLMEWIFGLLALS